MIHNASLSLVVVNAATNNDFTVRFNKDNGKIQIEDLRVSGGYIELGDVKVANTGKGEIRVLGYCKFCPFHISPVKQAVARAANKIDAISAVRRSLSVLAVSELVPIRLSTGVRSQNNDSAATVNMSNGQIRCSGANPATTPVNRGTSSRPQAPCSRGTIRARVRVC